MSEPNIRVKSELARAVVKLCELEGQLEDAQILLPDAKLREAELAVHIAINKLSDLVAERS